MRGMEVGADLEARVNIIRRVGAQAADGRVQTQGAVMTTQAGQRDSGWGGRHACLQSWTAVHREGTGRGLVGPQWDDLRRVRVMRRMAGGADAVAGVPHSIGSIGGEVV